MQILTLLKSGPEYRPEYLYRLADSILRHNPQAKITCLTDMDISHPGIKPVKHSSIYPKWWGKLQLFGMATAEPVLYMDIDTVCVGNLSPLIRQTPGFTMLPNIYHPGRVGSGVMSWYGDYSYLLKQFVRNDAMIMQQYITTALWGDQAFIERHLKHTPDLFGSECLSYKAQVKNKQKALPPQTSLVYFHGKPRPWQVNESWMQP